MADGQLDATAGIWAEIFEAFEVRDSSYQQLEELHSPDSPFIGTDGDNKVKALEFPVSPRIWSNKKLQRNTN